MLWLFRRPTAIPTTAEQDPAREATPVLETYIPLHPNEFLSAVAGIPDITADALEQLQSYKVALAEAVHMDFRRDHLDLLYRYNHFESDREHDGRATLPPTEIGEVLASIESLLLAANYRRLTPSQIEDTLHTASAWGIRLRIRFRDFKKLRVYSRGDSSVLRLQRNWYRLYRTRSIDVPIYRKLVVMYEPAPKPPPRSRSKKTPPVKSTTATPALLPVLHLKMFKNVPHNDVDMLLPGVVRMSLLEQSKIGIPTLWGFALMVSKLVRNIWLLALLGAMKVLTSMTFIVAFCIAGAVYSVKLFYSYRHARNRHLLNVAQNLYYQTLSNNAGVLLRLLDEAEQQKLCEALVLLLVLIRNRQHEGVSLSQLDQECEQLLLRLGVGKVNFDIEASIRCLAARGFVHANESGWSLVDGSAHRSQP